MNRIVQQAFTSRRRLVVTILTTLTLSMVIIAVVLAVRIQSTLATMDRAAHPAVTSEPDAAWATPTTGPLTTRDQEYLDSPPPDVFADLGDPRPRALSAVDAWVRMDVEAMQGVYLPAALDSVIGSPPVPGFRVEGEPVVETGGPSRAVVLMDTSDRPLEVVMVAADGAWMVESIGYR